MQAQQEERMAQMEQQMAEMQNAKDLQVAEGGWNNQLQLQQLKNQGGLQKTALTGRVKLQGNKMNLYK